MVLLIIKCGTSTPISRRKKRLDRQFSLYQTYAFNMVRVAGLEPARAHHPRDFKSLASTISPNPRERDFTTPWEREEAPKTKKRPAHCQALPASPSIREWSPA